jgi:hypothetical protein
MSEIPPASERVSMTSMDTPGIACAVVLATENVPESSVAIVSTRSCLVPSATIVSYTSRHSPMFGCDVPVRTPGAAMRR